LQVKRVSGGRSESSKLSNLSSLIGLLTITDTFYSTALFDKFKAHLKRNDKNAKENFNSL